MRYHSQLIIRSILVVLLVGTMMYSEVQGAQANFYVATTGNDAWSGTLPTPNAAGSDGPFATLARARDAIRELKATGALDQPLRVLVHGGTYYLPETLTLGPEDSGTASFPIIYMTYPGAEVVLSGGRVMAGWKPYEGKIWQCDLNALGLGELTFKQLFYNGERQPLARFPNVDPEQPRTGGFLYVAEGGVKDSKRLLKYDPAKLDPTKWAKPTLAEVDVYPYHNWNNNIISIAEIDAANHIITLATDATYELIRDTRFYIQNAFEELDAPGEWYLDSETATLYFWPPDDELAEAQVVVPALDSIIQIKGNGADNPVRHVRLGSFTLQVCRGTAMTLQAAQECTVVRCTITNTKGDGIVVDSNSSNNRLLGNDIAYIGNVGIGVSGENNLVSNNDVHDVGCIRNSFNHAISVSGRANVISHNLIHDVPAWGIVFGGYDNIIEYNEIYRFGLSTNLAGGIYAWQDPKSTTRNHGGIMIRFNKISDAVGYGMVTPGEWGPNPGWGIWLDDMIGDTTIYGNILVRNLRGGVIIHGGEDNLIENNIMGAGIPSTFNHIRPGDEPCNNRIIKNIAYYANVDPGLLHLYGWTVEAEAVAARGDAAPVYLCGWSSVLAAVSESDYNLFFPIRGDDVDALYYFRGGAEALRGPWADEPVEDRLAWWREQGYEAHSIIADPLFMDVARDDYRLKPESPAFELGWRRIPVERIGLQLSRWSWVPTPEQGPRAEFKAPKDTTGIVVDGDVSEWPWDDATRAEVIEHSAAGPLSTAPKSYACAAYDDEALYLAIRNLVQDRKAIKTTGGWGQQDGLEIAIQDVSHISGDRGPILNLYGFPNAEFESVTTAGASEEVAQKLGDAVTYAAQIGDDYWSCEWRIPWAATGIDPHKTKKLWFNIGVRKDAEGAWIAWQPTGAQFFVVENAGDLVLVR